MKIAWLYILGAEAYEASVGQANMKPWMLSPAHRQNHPLLSLNRQRN